MHVHVSLHEPLSGESVFLERVILVGLVAPRARGECGEGGRLARRHYAQVRGRLVGEVPLHCQVNWNEEISFTVYSDKRGRLDCAFPYHDMTPSVCEAAWASSCNLVWTF